MFIHDHETIDLLTVNNVHIKNTSTHLLFSHIYYICGIRATIKFDNKFDIQPVPVHRKHPPNTPRSIYLVNVC